MDSARPLREVFADLTGAGNAAGDAGDARELLGGQGHAGLPDELVAEAVVNFADTVPIEVAEHLAPFVTSHSAVGADEIAGVDETVGDESWLDLLVTAPTDADADELDDVAPLDESDADGATGPDTDSAFDLDVDFGAGADAGAGASTDAADDDAEWTPADGTTAMDDLDPSDLDDATTDATDAIDAIDAIDAEGADGVEDADGTDDLDEDDEPDIDDVG
jgi:hypothetical protein